MKKISGYIVVAVCLVCISSFSINIFSQEREVVITDKILEMDPDRRVIQVKDHQYYVTSVYIDDGTSKEPRTGLFYDLKQGDIVEVHFTMTKYNGFWQAKKVIILKGEKEKEFLESME